MTPKNPTGLARAPAAKRVLAASIVASAALLLVACPRAEDAADADRAAVDDGETAADTAVCLRGQPFVADGAIEVRTAEPADARRIGALRWQAHEGCERFVADLLTEDGSPAGRAGEVAAEVLRELAVVRVSLRDVEPVDAESTEATFDGALARASYTVRSPDGRGIYMDVHLAAAAEAHVTTLDEPARVIVDLRPGGPPLPGPAALGDRIVVLQPRAGGATYPLTVSGYARTFEANVVVRLEQDGEDVHEDFTTATGWLDAWGHYSLTIEQGPSGPVVLHVGEYSARDGTWEGVAIELQVR